MSAGIPDPKEIEELLLGGELSYTRVDAVRLSGVTREFSQRVWRAFGYPHMPDDAVAFTEGDIAALCRMRALIEEGVLAEDDVIRMVRAVGQTMTRLAEWQVDLLISGMVGNTLDPPDAESVKTILDVAEKHISDFEPMIVHAWRRQLAAAGTRAMATAAEDEAAPSRAAATIGFADMVSFTQLSRDLEELELARVVERFEETTSDVVAAAGGRLVKTLGDEVMFSADTPSLGAEIALCVAESIRDETEVPDVRVGVAHGAVLPLMGDVFGTTVNLAARLTAIARPGTVVIDAGLAAELAGLAEFKTARLARRPARGLGIVQPYVLRRGAPRSPGRPGSRCAG